MLTVVRVALLGVALAMGIATALALALQKPAGSPALENRVADHGSPGTTADRPVPDASRTEAKAAPQASPVAEGRVETTVPEFPVAPRIATYRDPIARQVDELEATLQQIEASSQRRERSMLHAIAALQDQMETRAAPPPAPAGEAPPAPAAPPAAAPPAEALPAPAGSVHRDAGDDKLTINIQNSDIRSVLEMLSQEAGLNILASRNVSGSVTANLSGVDVETALAAILKSTGFVSQREGNIIYVGTPADLALMSQSQDRVLTRIYRPNYIRAADFQALITSMLTPQVGRVTVSSPSDVDIPTDQTKTGGNGYPGTDVVIVRDYAAVLAEVDQIFAEVDVKPRQVAIEAMILSVKLSDTYKLGVSFEALRDNNNVRLVSGSPLASLGNIDVSEGGLKFGFMDANLSLFIDALEKIGDTNVIAAPRLTCLNKMRAEIQIGEELGYVSTTVTESSSTQTVNFLDVGTLLRIRPYIDNDGLIRLEVHPELSTGTVTVQQGLSLPQKAVTQVTTQVLCPDGCTVIIGGLIREDLTTSTSQIPLLGNLPWLGPVFRQKTETVDRNEIIVLITPRIVSEPFMCEEGAKYGNDYTQRQSIYFDKMSPIGKRNLGQHHLRLARAAYAAGDYATAMKQVNLAIHYDPLNRDAVVLRNEVLAAGGFEDESIHEYLHRGLSPLSGRHRDYSKQGYPWKGFEGFGPSEPAAIDDRGNSGPTRTILGSSYGDYGAGPAVPPVEVGPSPPNGAAAPTPDAAAGSAPGAASQPGSDGGQVP